MGPGTLQIDGAAAEHLHGRHQSGRRHHGAQHGEQSDAVGHGNIRRHRARVSCNRSRIFRARTSWLTRSPSAASATPRPTQGNLIVQGANNIEFGGVVTTDDNSNTLTVNGRRPDRDFLRRPRSACSATLPRALSPSRGRGTPRQWDHQTVISDGGPTVTTSTTTTIGTSTATVASTTKLVVGQRLRGPAIQSWHDHHGHQYHDECHDVLASGHRQSVEQLKLLPAIGSIAKSGTGTLTSMRREATPTLGRPRSTMAFSRPM